MLPGLVTAYPAYSTSHGEWYATLYQEAGIGRASMGFSSHHAEPHHLKSGPASYTSGNEAICFVKPSFRFMASFHLI